MWIAAATKRQLSVPGLHRTLDGYRCDRGAGGRGLPSVDDAANPHASHQYFPEFGARVVRINITIKRDTIVLVEKAIVPVTGNRNL